MALDRAYWDERYATSDTQWDIGGPSAPLKAYIDQLTDRSLRILIPGGGRAYEAEYLHRNGFTNVYVIDLSPAPYADLMARYPDFPKAHLLTGDFFAHKGTYDRIIEQTFFCALDPALRPRYVLHMHHLLAPGGDLVGLLFNDVFAQPGPPFGGTIQEYQALFRAHFPNVVLEPCYNSIAPRAGRELWLKATKPAAYVPIDCTLYDRYEQAATLKQRIRLVLVDGTEEEGVITDLFSAEGAEHLRLNTGTTVRLDRIRTMVNT